MRGWGPRVAVLGCLPLVGSLGCAKATMYSLGTLGSPVQNGELEVRSAARIDHQPAQGWDLLVDLDLTWRGQHRVRLDLTRTLVRVDGMAWSTCRPPADLDRTTLFVSMEPGDVAELSLRCEDVARPGEQVDLRLHATGTGGTGVLELSWAGIDGS